MSRPWREPRLTPDEKDGSGKFSEFAGVINTRSRKDLGLHALYVGDNVVISDSKKITRRPGYALTRAGVQSAFGLNNELYTVESGVLLHVASATDARTLVSGLTGSVYGWGEVNGEGYFVNSVDAGIFRGDNYRPWRLTVPTITEVAAVDVALLPATTFNIGAQYSSARWRFAATYETADGRETAPSEIVEVFASPLAGTFRVTVPPLYVGTNIYVTEPNGTVFRKAAHTTATTITIAPARAVRQLTTLGTNSLPTGVYMIEFYQGRCFAAEYIAAVDMTVIWVSKALGFHLFDQANDALILPGRLAMLRWCNEGLLFGTTQRVYHYDAEGTLTTLCEYGVVPGSASGRDGTRVTHFWTTRGICSAMPFKNLTEEGISMAPGVGVATSVVHRDGMKLFVAVTQGAGEAFNQRTERT